MSKNYDSVEEEAARQDDLNFINWCRTASLEELFEHDTTYDDSWRVEAVSRAIARKDKRSEQ